MADIGAAGFGFAAASSFSEIPTWSGDRERFGIVDEVEALFSNPKKWPEFPKRVLVLEEEDIPICTAI